jgi:hypothetical protein
VFVGARLHVSGGAVGGGKLVDDGTAVAVLDTAAGVWCVPEEEERGEGGDAAAASDENGKDASTTGGDDKAMDVKKEEDKETAQGAAAADTENAPPGALAPDDVAALRLAEGALWQRAASLSAPVRAALECGDVNSSASGAQPLGDTASVGEAAEAALGCLPLPSTRRPWPRGATAPPFGTRPPPPRRPPSSRRCPRRRPRHARRPAPSCRCSTGPGPRPPSRCQLRTRRRPKHTQSKEVKKEAAATFWPKEQAHLAAARLAIGYSLPLALPRRSLRLEVVASRRNALALRL